MDAGGELGQGAWRDKGGILPPGYSEFFEENETRGATGIGMTGKEYFYLYLSHTETDVDFRPRFSGEPGIFMRLNADQAKSLCQRPIRGLCFSLGFPPRVFLCNQSRLEEFGLRKGIRFSLVPEKLFKEEEWALFFAKNELLVDGRGWSRNCKILFTETEADIAILVLFQNRIVCKAEISLYELLALFERRKAD